MSLDGQGAGSLRRKFLDQFAISANFSFVAMGFYDGMRREFTESWLYWGETASVEEDAPMPREVVRALAVQASLLADVAKEPERPYPLWLTSGDYKIWIGRPVTHMFPVMVIPSQDWSEEPTVQAMLRIGIAYVQQQNTEAVYTRSPWPDGLAAATLQLLSLRFLVVDEKSEVYRDGRLEDDIAQDDPAWAVVNKRLTLKDHRERAQLHEAIGKATSEERVSSIIAVSTNTGGMRLVIIAPLPGADRPLAMILFEHARTDHVALREHFFGAHGLTPSERRIAHVLLDGGTPSEAADSTFLSVATVRSYLKSVFNKTGTHRQSELIALYYRSIIPVGTSIVLAGSENRARSEANTDASGLPPKNRMM